MEGKASGQSLPSNLVEILSSLGITGKPMKWNLSSTGFGYSLTLIWNQNEGKEQGCSAFKTTQQPTMSTTSNDCDSSEPRELCGEPKEMFVKPFLDSTEKPVLNVSKTDFSGITEVSQNENLFKFSSFKNKENFLRFKDVKKGIIEQNLEEPRFPDEEKKRQGFQTQKRDTNFKVDVDHLRPSNTSLVNKAKCSCGEEFKFKERAIKHILFSCPVSLCFRIDLDLRIHRAIDQWRNEEQRILGRKWWHAYKTSGFPDVKMSFPENNLDELERMVNEFLAKAGKDRLIDKDKNKFVLIKGLENLPYELERMFV